MGWRGVSVEKAPMPEGVRTEIWSQRPWPLMEPGPKSRSAVSRPRVRTALLRFNCGPIWAPALSASQSVNMKSQGPLTAVPAWRSWPW